MEMDVKAVAEWVAGALVVLASLVQISPIKINPWSALAKSVGNALVGEQLGKIDQRMSKIEKRLETQEAAFHQSADEAGRDRAETRRYRILRFGDECIHGQPHTQEMWNQVFDDITQYERYCTEHPGFKNEKAKMTEQIIKDAYQKALNNKQVL